MFDKQDAGLYQACCTVLNREQSAEECDATKAQ